MPDDVKPPDPTALTPYLDALEKLYAVRRTPKHYGRDAGKLETVLDALREAMTPGERVRADGREAELSAAYRSWLASQPEEPSTRSPDETMAPRRRPIPSTTLPGSEARIAELERRRRLGMELFAGDDVDDHPRLGLRTTCVRNGSRRAGDAALAVVSERGSKNAPTDPPSRIQILRERAGLTRKALARRAGLSLRCVTLLETRKRLGRPETLMGLSDALGCTVDYLLGRTPPKGR